MKSVLSILSMALALGCLTTFIGDSTANAESTRRARVVRCPVIVDRETGEYSASSAKYRCYEDSSSARRAGYSRQSFSDDSSCVPTPAPTPSGGGVTGNYNLSGPGQKETPVFSASNGGSITYSFLGGGQFEIKVLNAATGRRLERVLETTQAGSQTVSFSAQTVPVIIKIEGPGAWTVAVNLN